MIHGFCGERGADSGECAIAWRGEGRFWCAFDCLGDGALFVNVLQQCLCVNAMMNYYEFCIFITNFIRRHSHGGTSIFPS